MSSVSRVDGVFPLHRTDVDVDAREVRGEPVGDFGDSTSIRNLQQAAPAVWTAEGSHSIFETSAWLDAVAPGAWDVAEIRDGGTTLARMPYVLKSRTGIRVLTVPPLTPWLGPWIASRSGKYQTRLSHEHELVQDLIGKLPRFHAAIVPAAPEQTNMMPFHWSGFRLCVTYTYRIPLVESLSNIIAGAKQETRKTIKKARERVEIVTGCDAEDISQLISATYRRQGLATPALTGIVGRILTSPKLRDSHELLVARDERGRPHAFALMVFDARHCFYVIGGADPDLRASGAQTLLLWTAIERAKGRSAIFDFEGSMKYEIERAFRAFGAVQTPQITAYSERSVWGVAYRLAVAATTGAARAIAARRIGGLSDPDRSA